MITSSEVHPNAAHLHEQIKGRFPTVSLATIYKTFDLLKKVNEVLEIGLHDDNHYDPALPSPHLICTSCNKIFDGELETPVHALVNEMEQVFGFHILRHQLNFYGLCQDCQISHP